MSIINTGIEPDLPNYLRDKIRTSNQVALLMAGVGVCYTVFSVIFYPSLTLYPAFCIVLSFAAIGLNYMGMYHISRFILSTLVIFLAYIYHGFLVQPGESTITSLLVIEFSLSVIPWVLIDFREKKLLILSLTACFLLIFSQGWANDFLSIELDSSLFRSGFLNIASYIFSILILVSCMYFMQIKNYKAEVSNENLLQDIQQKNIDMEKQQLTMQRNLEELNDSRQIEERQNWTSKGIADISDLLRQSSDEDIYNLLLRDIITYIGANQGALHLLNEDELGDKYLEMAACYAYDRRKFVEKRIEIGQGLVGQCFLEGEMIRLKEVPKDYISITSGLGEAPPTFVVITPLKQENSVVGVLELAFFHNLEDHKTDFLVRLGETIASFITTNSLNKNTRKLLEQSQLQMEQLRAQEEEMRQNMEELQATQEEIHRKEKEYLQRITELEQLNAVLQK